MSREDFTLKQEDALAPMAVLEWIRLAMVHNETAAVQSFALSPVDAVSPNLPIIPLDKIADACFHLGRLVRHQADHGRKLPD